MAFKIFTKGNYFYIVDDTTNQVFEGHAKNISVNRTTDTGTGFKFANVNGWRQGKELDITEIKNEAGTLYVLADFVTFYEANTGFSTAPGGSGADLFGFFDYNDLATATTPIAVVGGAGFTDLTNDELGSFTNKNFPPGNVTDVWNEATQLFDFSQLTLGSKIDFRLDIQITTTSANQEIDIELLMAIGGTSYSLVIDHEQFKTAGTYNIVKSSFVYIGDANSKDNGAKFRVKSDSNMDVKVTGWACYVHLY